MADYAELVKSLRESAANKRLMTYAADAIEELSRDLERSRDYEAFWEEEAKDASGKLQRWALAIAKMPRWIPVTERLPEEDDDALIYAEWTGVSGTKYKDIILTDTKTLLHMGYKPIAWMPLPKPPEED